MNSEGWWIWVLVGLGLAALEVAVPGFIFLGFAVGGVATGGLLYVIGPALDDSPAYIPLIFAAFSLVAWVVLTRVFRRGRKRNRIWTTDINDNNDES